MQNKKNLRLLWLFLSLSFVSCPSFAGFVFDWQLLYNAIETYKQLKSQYELLKQTYENAQKQLNDLQQLVSAAEGHYGFGELWNRREDFLKQWGGLEKWETLLNDLSGGNVARYRDLLESYQREYPTLSQDDFAKGATTEQARMYTKTTQVNRTAMASATYAFDQLQERLETIFALSKKIDQAPNTKAAIDLNSRLLIEIAYIQAQELKMQIMINQQLAQTNAQFLSFETERAKFNRLPGA